MNQSTQISHAMKNFKIERDNTDESLDAEREKTNSSLVTSQELTEQKTDFVVMKKRTEVDKATTAARDEADASIPKGETSEIKSERALADKSVQQERSHIDAALGTERDTKRELVEQLLNQEREETDQNLSIERSETDEEVFRASGRLSNEVSAHSKTQTTLTSREEFLAIVSHDLKNPIGTASSCADMLLEDSAFKDMAPDTLKTWLELIKRNIDSSLRMIGDLLDMERIEENKLHLNCFGQDINLMIHETLENFASVASAKTVLLRNSSIKKSATVYCDRDRVMQVLSNLVGNAIKFTPEGGTVTLGTELKSEGVQICVRDTGPGIPQDKHATIFERFKQLKSGERKGLGLGLYISKKIIEAHGGKIWVQPAADQGSIFLFFLPKKVD